MKIQFAIFTMSALILAGLITPAYAPCPPIFSPPGYAAIPDDNVQAFLTFSESDRIETLVIQPAFSGTATEFGMVMPIPSRPEINEAPEELFIFLEEYTNQFLAGRSFGEGVFASDSSSSVRVIEQKDVGDFETTLLTAGSAKDLIDWLNEHDYQFSDIDEDNFDYYVQKGGYYFVALKVNMGEAKIDEEGKINGKLRPIEFVFSSEKPMLPIRIMAHDMDVMYFTLYTLTEFPYYVPGVDVIFKTKLEERKYGYAPSLDEYDPGNKWLVRMNIGFDPRAIEKNLLLQKTGDLNATLTTFDRIKINPHLVPSDAGILLGESKENFLVKNFGNAFSPLKQTKLGIPPESVECKKIFQLMLRPDGQNTSCMMQSSIPILSERGWQISTVVDEIERIS